MSIHGFLTRHPSWPFVRQFYAYLNSQVRKLFHSGSKRNWTSLHKAFHRSLPQHSIHTLDLRNHGASPYATPMTYAAMAEDVLHYIESRKLTNVSLLGHSMSVSPFNLPLLSGLS